MNNWLARRNIIENFGKIENGTKEEKDIFLNITTPPLELEVNLDKLLKQDYALVKYQVDNVFSKLRELTLKVSKFPLFLLYSLTVNCQKLNILKIEFINPIQLTYPNYLKTLFY